MKLSVVVTLSERADLLPQVLESLASQTLDASKFEVIVVASGSNNELRPVIDEFNNEVQIRFIQENNPGIDRDKALNAATGDVILFLGEGETLLPDTLYQHLSVHEANPQPEVAVQGRIELLPEMWKEPLMRFLADESEYFQAGSTSYKRQFALNAEGSQVIFNPLAITVIIRSISFDDFCNRLRKEGASQVEIGKFADDYMQRARGLDRWVRGCLEEGVQPDSVVMDMLYDAYRQALQACPATSS